MKKIRKFLQLKMPKGRDAVIHGAVIVLMIFGSVMVVSTTVGSSNDFGPVAKAIVKQCVFVALSYFAMVKFANNFMKWSSNRNKKDKKWSFYTQVYFVGFLVLFLLVSTLFFPATYGSRAWIRLGALGTLQPSEFAKVYLVVFTGVAATYVAGQDKLTWWQCMRHPIMFFCAFSVVIFLQPDVGTLLVMGLIFAICLLIPQNKGLAKLQKIIIFFLSAFLVALVFFSTDTGVNFLTSVVSKIGGENFTYKIHRVINAANPFNNLFGTGYNLVYSLYAIASGGMSGLGFGASAQKYGYLPEAETDFILAIIVEELGIFGLLIIVIGYACILYRLFYYASKTKVNGYRVILVGCASYLAIHFILNVGGITALIPLTGVPLLFISAGGSSMLAISILLGVCQSIIVMTKKQAQPVKKNNGI